MKVAQNPFLTWNPLVDHPVSLRKIYAQLPVRMVPGQFIVMSLPSLLVVLETCGKLAPPIHLSWQDTVVKSWLPGSWLREPAPGMLPCCCAPTSSPLSEFLRPQLFSVMHTHYHPRSPFSSDLELDGSHITSVAQSCPTLRPHGLQHASSKSCPTLL